MVLPTIMISSPYDSPVILVFGVKFRLHIPNLRSNTSGVGKNVVFSIKTGQVGPVFQSCIFQSSFFIVRAISDRAFSVIFWCGNNSSLTHALAAVFEDDGLLRSRVYLNDTPVFQLALYSILSMMLFAWSAVSGELPLGLPTVPNFSGQSRIRLLRPVSRTAEFGTG